MSIPENVAALLEARKPNFIENDYPRWIRFKPSEMKGSMSTTIYWEIIHIQGDGIVTMDYQNILMSEYPHLVKPISDFGEEDGRLVLLSHRILEWAVFMTDAEMKETDQLEAADAQLLSYAH